MTKRNYNNTTYKIETAKAVYMVTLEKIRNDRNGNPRYNANIIILDVKGEEHCGKTYYTANYSFTGHYCGDEGEAEYIVNRFEQDCEDE